MTENGRIVIPSSFRRALGIEPGEELIMRLEEDGLRITTARHRLAKARALVRKYIPDSVSLADELIAERREAAKLE
ncbi:AbrB/MazE/SpoVT family DNA-binding domain-containing protein [Silvibacterium bohemicum]|nr:AbrB/MazE/SpoVT family DNA-binding domain-containing protein [Silvibacterium bohemicum]